jgi:hypothetical protein
MIKEEMRNFKINNLTFPVYRHLELRLVTYSEGSGKEDKYAKNNLIYTNINAL